MVMAQYGKCNEYPEIRHFQKNVSKLDDTAQITVIGHDHLSYRPQKYFTIGWNRRGMSARGVLCANRISSTQQTHLINKVFSHACSYSKFPDYQTRLQHEGHWFGIKGQ